MTTIPAPSDSTVVVVTEDRKRRKGFLWIAGGAAAILVGGSTFALWSAQDSFAGGTITAGNLNIVKTADTAFYDVSADRLDGTVELPGTDGSQPGHLVDDATWRIVPGDKVAADFSADVTLEGDNLVAQLSLEGLDGNTLTNTGMAYTYEIYHDGALLVSESALPTAAKAPLLYLSAAGDGQAAGLEDANGTTVFAMTAGETTDDFTVVVYGTFDGATDDRDQVEVADTLSGLTLTLEQVRTTGAQFS